MSLLTGLALTEGRTLSIEKVPMKLIYPGLKARKIVDANVDSLAESMKSRGLLSPLLIRPAKKYIGGNLQPAYEIMAGNHRYKAAVKLGWQEIDADVRELDDLDAELITIDENLVRQDLGPAETARQFKRRQEIYHVLHPETKQGVAGGHGKERAQRAKSTTEGGAATGNSPVVSDSSQALAEKVAKATGKDVSTVRRDINRGKNIPEDVLAMITKTPLDKATYLDELKKLPDDEQRKKVETDLKALEEKKNQPKKKRSAGKSSAGGKSKKPVDKQAKKANEEEEKRRLEDHDNAVRYIVDELVEFIPGDRHVAMMSALEAAQCLALADGMRDAIADLKKAA
jgi:ParB-like chromosome segregation protein Spo0J